MSDKNKKMKKSATATTAPLRRGANKNILGDQHYKEMNPKKEKCLPEKCLDCPAKDLCQGKPEDFDFNIENLFKSGHLEEVKEEDLPEELKKFVSDVKGLGLGIRVEAREMKVAPAVNGRRFCRHCGAKLLESYVPADQYPDMPVDNFNKETGKRNFVKEYRCPHYREQSFWRKDSEHDCFAKRDIIQEA